VDAKERDPVRAFLNGRRSLLADFEKFLLVRAALETGAAEEE